MEMAIKQPGTQVLPRAISWKDININKFCLWGSAVSVVADSSLYPMEVVKTRIQVQGKVTCSLSSALCYGRNILI